MKNLINTILFIFIALLTYGQSEWGTVNNTSQGWRSLAGEVDLAIADGDDKIAAFDQNGNISGIGEVIMFDIDGVMTPVFNFEIRETVGADNQMDEGDSYYFEFWDSQTDTYLMDNNGGDNYGSYSTGQGDLLPPFHTFSPLQSAFPVEYTRINAYSKSCSEVIIEWQTASEKNNKGWIVEKSIDGKSWTGSQLVEGSGDSNKLISYQYKDKIVVQNQEKVFYRLRQLDYDGAYDLSDILVVNLNCNSDFNIYPNPANSFINIAGMNEGKVSIYNIAGVLIKDNIKSTRLDVSDLKQGMYLVRHVVNDEIKVKRLVIQ